jgi:hypothetical protein
MRCVPFGESCGRYRGFLSFELPCLSILSLFPALQLSLRALLTLHDVSIGSAASVASSLSGSNKEREKSPDDISCEQVTAYWS